MGGNLADLIDKANKRTAAANNKRFAKRSSDSQMLERLATASRGYLEALDAGNGAATALALAELRTATAIAERRSR